MTDKPDTTPEAPQPTPADLAAQRAEKLAAVRALLRTAIPPRIEVLKRRSFDDVIRIYDLANRDLLAAMRSGLLVRSKTQLGEAMIAFVTVIAACAFASEGVTILDDHWQAVHPEIEAAKKKGRVLSFEGLLGFVRALAGSPADPPPPPVFVTGMPPELRDDSTEDQLARRRAKFGTD